LFNPKSVAESLGYNKFNKVLKIIYRKGVNMSNEEVRNKLLEAVIKLIGQKPADKISIREIAKEAGTNSAAISYHFENKDKLIQEANKHYWLKLCKIYSCILEEDHLTVAKAEQYSKKIMDFYFQSTGVVRTEQNSLMNFGMDEDTKYRVNLQFNAIKYIIKSLRPEVTEMELTIKSIRFFSSLAHPTLWVEMYEKVVSPEISLDDLITAYIKDLILNI
jgi:AcrR family transcriptional regulator